MYWYCGTWDSKIKVTRTRQFTVYVSTKCNKGKKNEGEGENNKKGFMAKLPNYKDCP